MAEMANDPVCDMDVATDDAAATVDHEGRRFYFCSVGCAQEFRENPSAFA